jgi:tRNA pseudouridine38-40 synthase
MGNNKIQKMNRYLLRIEYDGTPFHGWQKQKNCKTVQGEIELAFYKLVGTNINVIGSGRTDTGVHAYHQIAHVDLEKDWIPAKLEGALNFFLKKIPISILEVKEVDNNFHARFSATSRIYEYKILIRQAPLVLQKNRYWHIWRNLEIEQMIEASNFLVGTHDFTTFRSSICQSNSPVKTIDQICIKEKIIDDEKIINFHFQARSFLHNQVRSIVGSLEKVGSKKWSPNYIKTILDKKDRKKCGPIAPPEGLYLKKIFF